MAVPTSNISLNAVGVELTLVAGGAATALKTITQDAVNSSAENWSGNYHNVTTMPAGTFDSAIGTPLATTGEINLGNWGGYYHDEILYCDVFLQNNNPFYDWQVSMSLLKPGSGLTNIFNTPVTAGGGSFNHAMNFGPNMWTYGDYTIWFDCSVVPLGRPGAPAVHQVMAAGDLFSSGVPTVLNPLNGFFTFDYVFGTVSFSNEAFDDMNVGVNPPYIPWNRVWRLSIDLA